MYLCNLFQDQEKVIGRSLNLKLLLKVKTFSFNLFYKLRMTTRKNFNGSELQFIIVLCYLFQIHYSALQSFSDHYSECYLFQNIYFAISYRIYIYLGYIYLLCIKTPIHINESSMFWCNGQIAVMVIHI